MKSNILKFPVRYSKFKKMTQEQRNDLIQEAIDNLHKAQKILDDLAKKHEERIKREKGNE